MPIDKLPGTIRTKTRDEERDSYLRDYKLRVPDAITTDGSQPYVDATVHADAMMPVWDAVPRIANRTSWDTVEDEELNKRLRAHGLDEKRPATGAAGFVRSNIASGGAPILAGTQLRHQDTGTLYECAVSDTCTSTSYIPVTGITTGTGSNRKAGTVLQWISPPPGVSQNATVLTQSDGSGLSGGRGEETDTEAQQRAKEKLREPAAAGNIGDYIETAEATAKVPVQKAFAFPAVKGPGTIAIAVLLRPESPGASRIPNGVHLGLVEADLRAEYPADDGLFVLTALEQEISISLGVTWATAAGGWIDPAPWPTYLAAGVAVDGAVAITATAFRVTTTGTITAPVVGQTIGLYDRSNRRFVRKKIATVTEIVASKSWDLTIETAQNASDTVFVPSSGARVSPWAESINDVVSPILSGFDALGVGEQFASFADPGLRQKRYPPNPQYWPSVLTNRILEPIFTGVGSVADIDILRPSVPQATTVGTATVSVYVKTLSGLAVYPQ